MSWSAFSSSRLYLALKHSRFQLMCFVELAITINKAEKNMLFSCTLTTIFCFAKNKKSIKSKLVTAESHQWLKQSNLMAVHHHHQRDEVNQGKFLASTSTGEL